jgi:CheY-like chemotaxis protein
VFDRFRQADSGTTRSHMGLGLGLAIVRHIVELHGGRVNVTSDGPGLGATFRLTLPAVATTLERAVLPARQTVDARAAAIGNADAAGRAIAGLRVLVVDDDPDTVQLLAELLGQHEVVVHVSGSVEQAVVELARETPDLIISDIAMPGRDGYDLLKHVRAQIASELPVLAVSAYARIEDRARSAHAGFAAHVAKPLDIDELLVAMAVATGRTSGSGL